MPSEDLTGLDPESGFIELCYDIFRDRETMRYKLLMTDILLAESTDFELKRTMNVIHDASFLMQVQVATRVVEVTVPQLGSVILGRQLAGLQTGEIGAPGGNGPTMWRHDEASFARMWTQVGKETGTCWRVKSSTYLKELSQDEWKGIHTYTRHE